ncbi:unnamed protein product, partial [Prunus brigantina]
IVFVSFATICSAQPVVILPLLIFLDRIHSIIDNLALVGSGSYGFSQYSSSQLYHQQNKGILGPSPSDPHNSSFRSHSFPRGPLQCYNCRGYGHVAAICPSKATFMPAPPTCLQGMIAHHLSHGGTQQRITDTGANTHITNDLSHISLAREYHGSDNVRGVLGGTGLPITHIGHSRISHLNSSFSLNNILPCPNASLPLLFINLLLTTIVSSPFSLIATLSKIWRRGRFFSGARVAMAYIRFPFDQISPFKFCLIVLLY